MTSNYVRGSSSCSGQGNGVLRLGGDVILATRATLATGLFDNDDHGSLVNTRDRGLIAIDLDVAVVELRIHAQQARIDELRSRSGFDRHARVDGVGLVGIAEDLHLAVEPTDELRDLRRQLLPQREQLIGGGHVFEAQVQGRILAFLLYQVDADERVTTGRDIANDLAERNPFVLGTFPTIQDGRAGVAANVASGIDATAMAKRLDVGSSTALTFHDAQFVTEGAHVGLETSFDQLFERGTADTNVEDDGGRILDRVHWELL